jgi:hypothetical protein
MSVKIVEAPSFASPHTEHTNETNEVFHRYDDQHYAPMLDEFDDPIGVGTHKLVHRTYPVIKRTPKGVWLSMGFGEKRFVLLTARKRYALPTKAEALESFLLRKSRQEDIYNHRAASARNAQRLAFAEFRKLKIVPPESVEGLVAALESKDDFTVI